MADLDRDLSTRLSRLAEAVPVGRGRLDPVHRTAVAARQRVRMAWVTPLVFIAVAALLFVPLGVGPFPGGLANPPVSATTRSGDFELTIRSARSRYMAGEPIDISASLTYLGSASPIEIGHEIGQDGLPIGFGVTEPIFPGYFLSGGVSRLLCHRTTIASKIPIDEAFRKAGGGYGPGDGTDFVTYMHDPVFWLKAGTWHPYAAVRFSIGSCGANVDIRAEIPIEVLAPAAAESSAPTASASTDRATSTVTEGDFELTLMARKPMFSVDETLDVVASLTYQGPDENIVIHHLTWGPLEFGMSAPGIILNPRGRWTCSDLEMTRGVPITESLLDLGRNGTPFAVAHGLHEITAMAQFSRGSCSAPADTMETSIIVAVADGPDDIPLLTEEPGQGGACLLLRNGGRLATSDTGLGVVTFDGTLRDVVWPNGYSARRTADGAVLLGRDGEEIARVGDDVEFDAHTSEGHPLRPCGGVTAIKRSSPTEAPPNTETPPSSVATDAGFELRLAAANPTFQEDAPIEVEWSLVNATNPGAPQVLAASPLVAFSAREVGGSRQVEANVSPGCAPFGLWTQGVPTSGSFEGSGPFSNWSDPAFVHGFGQDRDLYLPVGTWVLSATTRIFDDACEITTANLQTSITITILP